MKLNSASVKILTLVYILILAAIIFMADIKSTRYMLHFVGNVPFGDKIGHFMLMGVFSFLVNICFGFVRFKRFLSGSLIVFVLVLFEEFSQIFIPGRSFDLSDLVADGLGILILGELAAFIFRRNIT